MRKCPEPSHSSYLLSLGKIVFNRDSYPGRERFIMIAAAGTVKLQAGERAGFDLNADVTLRLQNLDNQDEALRRAKVRYKL